MMNDSVVIRAQCEGDKEQVKSLWKTCFDDTDKFIDWFFSERWHADYGVVAEYNGVVVSAIQGWHYTLNIRGKQIPACIMSGVSTNPKYRNRGYMSLALARFMKNAHDRGEYAVFCKPAKHTAYFKYLHYTSSNICLVRPAEKKLYARFGDVQTFDTSSISPDLLMDAYKNCIEVYSNSVIRSQSDMELKFRDYSSSDGKVICIAENGKINAYCVCTQETNIITVDEVCAPNSDYRNKLLEAVVSFYRDAEYTIKFPEDMVGKLPEGFTSECIANGVMAAADIPHLLKELAGFDDVTVGVNDHILASNNGVFNFSGEHCKNPCDIVIDSGHLLQLLNGFYSIDELIEKNCCRIINKDAVEKLRNRLPKLKCYTVEEY